MKTYGFFNRNVHKNGTNKFLISMLIAILIIIGSSIEINGAKIPNVTSNPSISSDEVTETTTEFELKAENPTNSTPNTVEETGKSDNVTEKVQKRASCNYPVIKKLKEYSMSTVELLQRAGYKTETHYVTTEDGYILQVHRIPANGKPAVYLLHGFLQSSRDFLLNCDGRALAHKLYNDGYDVWLGNYRGNMYGKNHTNLSPKSSKFWAFSMDELFMYDGPAAVNYILNVTGQEKLNWVGFSFGNTVLFGMLSLYPGYNDKINLGVSLAAEVYLGNTRSPALKFFSNHQRLIEWFFETLFNGEAFGGDLVLLYNLLAPNLCLRSTRLNRPSSCPTILWHVDGRDPKQLNHAYLPLTAGGLPSSTSARLIGQSLQWVINGRFEKYDFGSDEKNMAKYGTIHPPEFNLKNVKIPIVNFWSENDFFCSKANVMKAVMTLPNVIENNRVNWTEWNHLDYLYGKDADLLIYNHIIKVLRQWNPVS